MKASLGRAVLVMLAAFACHPAGRLPTTTTLAAPIFRSVQVDGGVIRLGAPLPAIIPAAPGDTIVSVPRGIFAGAERISVRRDRQGRVRSIHFDYPQTADFRAMLSEYTGMLGRPASHALPQGPEDADRVTWRDARTRFELLSDPRRNAATVASALTDLAP